MPSQTTSYVPIERRRDHALDTPFGGLRVFCSFDLLTPNRRREAIADRHSARGVIVLPKVCIGGLGVPTRGFPFDCFEMSDQVGGNWAFKNKNGRLACQQSLHIDTSKYRVLRA